MKHRGLSAWRPVTTAAVVVALLAVPAAEPATASGYGHPGDLPVTVAAQPRSGTDPAELTRPHRHRHHRPISRRELEFRNDMRRLWEDHVVWTRMAIVSFAADLPDFEPTAQRLLRNQADIGDAFAPYYGRQAADQLTGLLEEHILIAVDVLVAAKAGDEAALADAQARWEGNADEIAAFLHAANPRHWRLSMMRSMMREHLALTTQEAVARLNGDFEADIAAYDAVHHHILGMADTLSTGVVHQFPHRFAGRG